MTKQALIKGSKIIYFSTQVYCDVLNTKRLLPSGNTIKLRFIRNDDNSSIIAATGNYKIQIIPDSLCLSLRKITPSLAILNQHKKLFSSGRKAIFLFQQSKITTHLITAGTQSISLSNICTGPLPCQIFAVMVDHDAFDSSPKKDPWIFKPNSINSYPFLVNEESVPAEMYKLDLSNDKYMRENRNLHDCIRVSFSNSGNSFITYHDKSTLSSNFMYFQVSISVQRNL